MLKNPKGKKLKKNITMDLEGGRISAKRVIKNIINPIKNVAKKGISEIVKGAEAVQDYGEAVIFGRNDFSPKVRNILKKVGNKMVKSITIKRSPVPSLLTGALSLFSLGKFGKRLERSFDELFHLYIEMTLDDNSRVLLEKNEVINMDINPKSRPKTESKLVNTQIPQLTINEMLDNTENYMGEKDFFGYSVINNCQDFIVAFFKSNNIGDESDITFIKQDTKQLFQNLPYLRKLANTVTDLGAKVNEITTGAGIEELKNYGMMLNHLTSHIADPTEPIDPKDYKQSKIIIDAIEKEKGLKEKGLKDKDYLVQSVVFDKDKFNVQQAKKWLKDNKYKSSKVDKQENTLRFRQEDPNKVEKKGFTEYRTKDLENSGIKLIIVYKKNKISGNGINMEGEKITVHHIHHIFHHKGDSDSDIEDMKGGKIDIGRAFKKAGRDIKRGFEKEIAKPVMKEVINPVGDYVTKKKGGLASDVITYGIPATSSALLGGLATAATGGNPVAGVLASAVGSKLGSMGAKEIKKVSGTGAKKFVKGSQEAKEHMARIRAMKKN